MARRNPIVKCQFCSHQHRKSYMSQHVRTKHPGARKKKKIKYLCVFRNCKYSCQPKKFRQHMRSHHPQYANLTAKQIRALEETRSTTVSEKTEKTGSTKEDLLRQLQQLDRIVQFERNDRQKSAGLTNLFKVRFDQKVFGRGGTNESAAILEVPNRFSYRDHDQDSGSYTIRNAVNKMQQSLIDAIKVNNETGNVPIDNSSQESFQNIQ